METNVMSIGRLGVWGKRQSVKRWQATKIAHLELFHTFLQIYDIRVKPWEI
jgi:hypothetical protein